MLIVDDNPSVASLLSHALRAEGCEVDVCDDGMEALASIAAHPPDLILLDLELPSLPGDVICRRLKNDPGHQSYPYCHGHWAG